MALVLLVDRVLGFFSLLTLAIGLALLDGQLIRKMAFDQLFCTVGVMEGAQLLLAWRVGMIPLGALGGLLCIAGVRGKRDAELAPIPAPSVPRKERPSI
jgi:hypothetical protein